MCISIAWDSDLETNTSKQETNFSVKKGLGLNLNHYRWEACSLSITILPEIKVLAVPLIYDIQGCVVHYCTGTMDSNL